MARATEIKSSDAILLATRSMKGAPLERAIPVA
jgi:hypothetical protein